jgi:hypothetical protein
MHQLAVGRYVFVAGLVALNRRRRGRTARKGFPADQPGTAADLAAKVITEWRQKLTATCSLGCWAASAAAIEHKKFLPE